MNWVQARPFDQSKAGSTPKLCLRNTRLGFGIPEYFPSAWQAWLYTEQHTDFIPTGLDVPVFFSYWATIGGKYANWGHIGVNLASGKFWSDGIVYANLAAFLKLHSNVKYVGWGESINEVKVMGANMGNDIIQNQDNWFNRCNTTHYAVRGRYMEREFFNKSIVGLSFLRFVEILEDDPEAAIVTNWQNVGKQAVEGNWKGQIASLKVRVAELETDLKAKDATIIAQAKLIKELQAGGEYIETKVYIKKVS